jgi:hypothetical protein
VKNKKKSIVERLKDFNFSRSGSVTSQISSRKSSTTSNLVNSFNKLNLDDGNSVHSFGPETKSKTPFKPKSKLKNDTEPI